jgi:hypothetical protein
MGIKFREPLGSPGMAGDNGEDDGMAIEYDPREGFSSIVDSAEKRDKVSMKTLVWIKLTVVKDLDLKKELEQKVQLLEIFWESGLHQALLKLILKEALYPEFQTQSTIQMRVSITFTKSSLLATSASAKQISYSEFLKDITILNPKLLMVLNLNLKMFHFRIVING